MAWSGGDGSSLEATAIFELEDIEKVLVDGSWRNVTAARLVSSSEVPWGRGVLYELGNGWQVFSPDDAPLPARLSNPPA